MAPKKRLEPLHQMILDPKSSVSINSTTLAYGLVLNPQTTSISITIVDTFPYCYPSIVVSYGSNTYLVGSFQYSFSAFTIAFSMVSASSLSLSTKSSERLRTSATLPLHCRTTSNQRSIHS